MDWSLLLRGFVLGFSIAAPVGPIGLLVIRRTLSDGRRLGLATGLGAATADACYGAVAVFGLTALSDFLVGQQTALRLVGGLFLLYLGARTFFSRPAGEAARVSASGSAPVAWLTTFFLTLTNPMTILSFAAIFAGLNAAAGGKSGALVLILGVFAGSAAWWLALSALVTGFRGRLALGSLVWVNRVSGLVIAGFGVVALLAAL